MNQSISNTNSVVMDVLPWPSGYGFNGGDAWWQHTLSQGERERLDDLVGLALLDKNVCDQLIIQRDPKLLDAFALSLDTRHWLTAIKANTLQEFAQALLSASYAYQNGINAEAA